MSQREIMMTLYGLVHIACCLNVRLVKLLSSLIITVSLKHFLFFHFNFILTVFFLGGCCYLTLKVFFTLSSHFLMSLCVTMR